MFFRILHKTPLFALIFSLLSIVSLPSQAQSQLYEAWIIGEDTIIQVFLPRVQITAKYKFKSKAEKEAYNKRVILKRDVRKSLGFARDLGGLVSEMDRDLAALDSKRDKKQYLKLKEEELTEQFESRITKMTSQQGDIFIKLVHRETGMTAYDIITKFKSKSSARKYNTIARLKGINLKDTFGSDEEDELLLEYFPESS